MTIVAKRKKILSTCKSNDKWSNQSEGIKMWNPPMVTPEDDEEEKNEAQILSHRGSKGKILKLKIVLHGYQQ